MKPILSRGNTHVYLFEKQYDLNKFARIKEIIYQDKALHGDLDIEDPQRILNAMREEGPSSYWSSVFPWPATQTFVLYVENELAGVIDLTIENDSAVIDGLHILSTYRGQKLCDPLYQACINHVLENSDINNALVKIKTINEPSIGAADRNGFTEIARDEEHVTLEKDLSSFRITAPAPVFQLGLS